MQEDTGSLCQSEEKKCQIIIPIYHPDAKFIALLESLKKQIYSNFSVMIIDSGSDGSYRQYFDGLCVDVKIIDSCDFNHGGTRQKALDSCSADICVYLTQDAILADEYAIMNLLIAFNDCKIGCAYGRQLPHTGANPFASFARGFNYGADSYVRELRDKEKYGIKTAFISNSFAAYRRIAMQEIGGFAVDLILSEDMYAAARMLLKGWRIAYCAEAAVFHSHNYTLWQEGQRYFDIGVFQGRERWISEIFGKAEGEGIRFVLEEANYLIRFNPLLLVEMVMRDGLKFVGYRLGRHEKLLPVSLKRQLSMNKAYWR